MADKSDIPKGQITAADLFPLIQHTPEARQARDAWKAAAHASTTTSSVFFEWDGEEADGMMLKVLGRYVSLPLIAKVEWVGEEYDFATLVYHPDSGLLESVNLLSLSARDFYRGKRASQSAAARIFGGDRLDAQYAMREDSDDIVITLDAWHEEVIRDFPPDVALSVHWDQARPQFVKTEEPFSF